jgi:hypothetical protein
MSDYRSRIICTQSDVMWSKSVMSMYQNDSCDDHWKTGRIFLSTWEEPRIYIYIVLYGEMTKQIAVRCCTDISFVTYENKISNLKLD